MKPRHWWWAILLVLIVAGLARLRFDAEVLNLLPAHLPVVQGLKLYQAHFAQAQELVVTVAAADAGTAQFAARKLAAAFRRQPNLVAAATWQPPWRERPELAAEFIAYLWLNQPPDRVAELRARLAVTNLPPLLHQARETLTTTLSPADIAQLSYDPFGLTQLAEPPGIASPAAMNLEEGSELFAAADGTFRLLYVHASPELATYRDCAAWLQQIRAIERDCRTTDQLSADVAVRYTGRPAFLSEIATGMEQDMRRSVLGMSVIIAGLFWLAHRRWLPLLWLLGLLIAVLAGTLACGGLLVGTLNVVSAGFAAILLGLAADYGMVLYQEARTLPGQSARRVRQQVQPSILWAATTTAGAFLTLNLSGLPGLAQLGSLVAIGVALAAVIMLAFYLPPLMRGKAEGGRRKAEGRGQKAEGGRRKAEGGDQEVENSSGIARSDDTGKDSQLKDGDEDEGREGDRMADGQWPMANGKSESSLVIRHSSVTAQHPTSAEERRSPRAEGGRTTPESCPSSFVIRHSSFTSQPPTSGIQHPTSGIQHPTSGIQHPASGIQHPASGIQHPASGILRHLLWPATILWIVVPLLILWRGRPALDHSAEALRPLHSAAYTAMEEIKSRMERQREPFWLLVAGPNEATVAGRLAAAQAVFQRAVTNGDIRGFTLPLALWPHPEHQATNRQVLAALAQAGNALRSAALAHGFTTNALVLTDSMLAAWRHAAQGSGVCWPTNANSQWILNRFTARPGEQFMAVGLVYPSDRSPPAARKAFERMTAALPRDGVWLTGWEPLGEALLAEVKRDFWRVLGPMALLVCASLWLTFRRWSEVGLSFATLLSSALGLWAVMQVAGWSWNLLNLMALPLLLGAGVDYSIHLQLALRRHRGDRGVVRQGIGRAVLLCGGTTIAGFGSLAWSSNAGLASLGQVCAAGIACTVIVSLVMLPWWWSGWHGKDAAGAPDSPPRQPSAFYRAGLWRWGVALGPWLATPFGKQLCRAAAGLYAQLAPHRRAAVVQNLLPVVAGNRSQAERLSREVFRQMAQKLADLWRFEKGGPIDDAFATMTGWEHFARAQARGRGVLLLTLHLGNWEFGGPLMTREGVKLHVLTRDEPGGGFTALRLASRAKWGIETLVVGANPFDVVEVIKRLDAGATVASLMDRPDPATAVTVRLFDRPFPASVSAAELARASGCALVPVYIVWTGSGYAARLLPEIAYDRRALGQAGRRRELTQEIMRAFEPVIRQHPDQWYHFVPVWPESQEDDA